MTVVLQGCSIEHCVADKRKCIQRTIRCSEKAARLSLSCTRISAGIDYRRSRREGLFVVFKVTVSYTSTGRRCLWLGYCCFPTTLVAHYQRCSAHLSNVLHHRVCIQDDLVVEKRNEQRRFTPLRRNFMFFSVSRKHTHTHTHNTYALRPRSWGLAALPEWYSAADHQEASGLVLQGCWPRAGPAIVTWT